MRADKWVTIAICSTPLDSQPVVAKSVVEPERRSTFETKRYNEDGEKCDSAVGKMGASPKRNVQKRSRGKSHWGREGRDIHPPRKEKAMDLNSA